jgi:hypothetical protein
MMDEAAENPVEQPAGEIVLIGAPAPQPAAVTEPLGGCGPKLSRGDELLLNIGGRVVFTCVAGLGIASLALIAWVVYLGLKWYLPHLLHAYFW